MSNTAAIDRAEAHVRARLGDGDVAVTRTAGPASFTIVRGAIAGAYPGTGVAVAIVSPEGHVFGRGLDTDLALIVDEAGFDPSPAGARTLAELLALASFDGLEVVLDDPPPSASITADGIVVEADIRNAMGTGAMQLHATIPAAGPVRVDKRRHPQPIPIDRATAVERALAANDAMAIQTALRAITGALSAREMAVLARIAVTVPGPIGTQARNKLGSSPEALAALERAQNDEG